MSDSKYQETVAHEDDGDPKENDQPATANLMRAVEVAEELLQAIKQAIPTPTGKQSVLGPPFSWGFKPTRCAAKKIKIKTKNYTLPGSAHKKKIASFPGFPSTPN